MIDDMIKNYEEKMRENLKKLDKEPKESPMRLVYIKTESLIFSFIEDLKKLKSAERD